jgi:hypothetical protein
VGSSDRFGDQSLSHWATPGYAYNGHIKQVTQEDSNDGVWVGNRGAQIYRIHNRSEPKKQLKIIVTALRLAAWGFKPRDVTISAVNMEPVSGGGRRSI